MLDESWVKELEFLKIEDVDGEFLKEDGLEELEYWLEWMFWTGMAVMVVSLARGSTLFSWRSKVEASCTKMVDSGTA